MSPHIVDACCLRGNTLRGILIQLSEVRVTVDLALIRAAGRNQHCLAGAIGTFKSNLF